LAAKVKSIYLTTINSRTDQNKKDSMKSEDSKESISNGKEVRQRLQYMNLPSDI
jgi:hypothetical protein